jgi:hypothetical protein
MRSPFGFLQNQRAAGVVLVRDRPNPNNNYKNEKLAAIDSRIVVTGAELTSAGRIEGNSHRIQRPRSIKNAVAIQNPGPGPPKKK